MSDGVTEYEGAADDVGRYLVSGLPSRVPVWLFVDTDGPYTLDIDPGTTGLPPAVPAPSVPDLTLALTTDAPSVAAYWSAGQTVTGTLTLTSTATTPQQLALDWATSDPDWSVELAQGQVDLAAGATVQVSLTVRVLPDAAVDDAIRLTIRARDAAGGQTTGWTEIASDPDAAPTLRIRSPTSSLSSVVARHLRDEIAGLLRE